MIVHKPAPPFSLEDTERLSLTGWAMLGAGMSGLMTAAFLDYRRLWRPLK